MRVVSFSTDWSVFDERSAVARRQRMQASTLERLEVFVPHGPKQIAHLAPNATIRGFGLGRTLGALRAILAALRLPQPDIVSAQDPFLIGLTAWCAARLSVAPAFSLAGRWKEGRRKKKRAFLRGVGGDPGKKKLVITWDMRLGTRQS